LRNKTIVCELEEPLVLSESKAQLSFIARDLRSIAAINNSYHS